MGEERYLPLFETTRAKGRVLYRLFAVSVFVGICLIWVYRVTHIPKAGEDGRFGWMCLFAAELWFSFYWVVTQATRWGRIYRHTFKDRLSQRYEKELPGVDIFVCTADPIIEPPMMVMNTVLSVVAYDYPPEKLSVYLSDDGGSELTYYALLEAAEFAKHWIPHCKKYSVEPRSPAAYFVSTASDAVGDHSQNQNRAGDVALIKKLYEDMENRIENAVKLGRISEEVRSKHKGFSQWNSYSSKLDHDTILQIVVDGRNPNARDVEGCMLPTLVYLAREKRPQYHHNFKAGAMNALIRVSSSISNGKLLLNVDCDMYSNNSMAIRDALCFFMDEEQGHEIAYVQFPQNFDNLTKNELYASLKVINEVEAHGLDNYWGTLYIGSGCFHRREVLCGNIFSKGCRSEMKWEGKKGEEIAIHDLEETSKSLASCAFEENTQWGKEISSRWIIPFAYVIIAKNIGSFLEYMWCGGTTLGWWNDQRIWLYQRITSYLFAFIDTIVHYLGYTDSAFVITAKVADEDVSERYKKEIMEFGGSSPMFTVLATLALLNLYCFAGFVQAAIAGTIGVAEVYETMCLQILLCGVLIVINLPLYEALYLRKDKGKLPSSVAVKSMAFAGFACICSKFIY